MARRSKGAEMGPITWIFTGKWAPLDNFYHAPIDMPGIGRCDTVEHAFQAAKASNRKMRERIRLAAGPGAAKALGRRAARTGGRVALPAGIDLTPAESAMVAHLNRALPGPDACGELLNRLGRERTYGYAAEGEVAESARQKLAAAWRG